MFEVSVWNTTPENNLGQKSPQTLPGLCLFQIWAAEVCGILEMISGKDVLCRSFG